MLLKLEECYHKARCLYEDKKVGKLFIRFFRDKDDQIPFDSHFVFDTSILKEDYGGEIVDASIEMLKRKVGYGEIRTVLSLSGTDLAESILGNSFAR